MSKNRRQLKYLMLTLLYAFSLRAEPRLIDRLIFEINGKSYTQRQLEIYYAVRTIAAGQGPGKALLDTTNWPIAVETFRKDMIIHSNIESEQARSETFQADNHVLQSAEKEIQRIQLESRQIKDFFKKQGVTEEEIQKNLMMVYRVQAFARTRLQVLSQDGDVTSKELLAIEANSDWFTLIQKNTTYRFYDHSKEYVPLHAFRKLP